MEEKIRVHAVITGRVQGVFFRMETKTKADSCHVTGWVRNKRDGSVEALFEGNRKNVEAVVKWCRSGPSLSRVAHVEVASEDFAGEFESFEVTY